jgi:hypothetical protein
MFQSRFCSSVCGLIVVCLLPLLGCSGSDRPELAKASGKVTLNGEPVSGASVMYVPATGGRAASGVTDENGVYRMSSYDDPELGVAVGEHRVSVSKIGGDGAFALSPAAPAPADPNANLVSPIAFKDEDPMNPPKIEYLVPHKYGNPESSGLTVTVPADGSDQLNLELTK